MLPAYNTVKFDNVDLNTFGVFVTGSGTYNAPERAVSVVEVPGRSGDLVFDDGRYKNITLSYPCFITGTNGNSFETNFRNLKGFLFSRPLYSRIEDTYHPDEFRLGYYKGPLTVTPEQFTVSAMQLDFICKPMRYLKSGETGTQFTSNGSVTNPSYMTSKPLLRIYGAGTVTLGSYEVVVDSHEYDYVDVDSELMDCHYGSNNLNSKVTFSSGFPEITSGEHGINLGTGITKVIVTPRWWVL